MRGAAGLVIAVLLGSAPLLAQRGSRLWRPDERVVIGDFRTVDALAVSQEVLYVSARGGLGVYDRRFARWEPPITPVDGYPIDRALSAIVDPLDRSLWVGTGSGLVHYQPVLRHVETLTVAGGVRELMFDRADAFGGLFLLGRSGWQFLARGSLVPLPATRLPPAHQQLRTAKLDDVLNRIPFAEAMGARTLTDARLRRVQYTAAAVSATTGEIYLGTSGLGVLRVDETTATIEPLSFGLLSRDVTAVVTVPGGVWIGSGPLGPRNGFTFVSSDLQRYEYEEGNATSFGFRIVRDMIARGRALWAATDQGVVRLEPGVGATLISGAAASTIRDTYTLTQSASGVWVGTRRGLFFVSDDGEVEQIDERVVDPILAVAAARDSVWVGGPRGLGRAWLGSSEIIVPADVAEGAYLKQRIVAATLSADTVVAATAERISWRASRNGWVLERVLSGDLGELTSLAGDAGGVWIGGSRGLAFYRFRSRDYLIFNAAGDLPGRVQDLAVDRTYLWVATDNGLVRLSKNAVLP